MKTPLFAVLFLLLSPWLTAAQSSDAKDPKAKPADPAASFVGGLRLRSIGPAVTSGRIASLAVNPNDRAHYFVGVASGGVWKTTNAGTTWTPVFDDQGSYSIGWVTMDPKNPNTVWVGTGENNSQRSVSWGDGVYRSDDGGKSWKNLGLKSSEHIGKIVIDPRDSNIVYVAAQGPLWGPGGDRGLYKTTDGGKSWSKILTVSENTGVSDLVLDPANPNVILAAAYQRRRHVWTLINGGPESAIYKSKDAGATWNKVRSGLPTEELGRIGLAAAATKSGLVYATVEAADKKGGIFRSTDFGESWEKRNDFDQGAMYYGHIVVDPANHERIYVMNVFLQVSDDGGKTLRNLGERAKHVDNHCIWIDPRDPNYHLVGCDGGLYESHDRGEHWKFLPNLPVTQFYDVTCDQDAPFYRVYGGTQDNYTLGGPARTRSAHGIGNHDWFVTQGGDGFQCRVDPKDSNIVYSTMQYGGLVRFDRRTGEQHGIQPQPGQGEPPLRYNWDSALIISPHLNTRLYFAANRLFRSDDRGDTWKPVSPDLTRQIDRNALPVMGKVWPLEAVAKSQSTSFYGNIVALSESPKQEGLIYVGTDDGLIQATEDGGQNWRKIEKFPGVPERTYVARLCASQHDAKTVYAAFENHKMADFAPYLLKSADAGKSWTSIVGDLPAGGPVLAFAEDHVNPNLLFVGTEYGLFATVDGGKKWHRLKSGLPTIAVRDLAIQKQMNDLVVGTFGRGIYILDDYSPMRQVSPETLGAKAKVFDARPGLLYVESRQFGLRGKAFLGETFYTAANPPFGATFTYWLKDSAETKKQQRRKSEKAALAKNEKPPYPSHEQIRAEAEEEAPAVLLTISDASGAPLRRLTGPAVAGLHRVAWDLRAPSPTPPRARPPSDEEALFGEPSTGPLVAPGKYHVSLALRAEGKETPLAEPVAFQVEAPAPPADREAELMELQSFLKESAELQRKLAGAMESSSAAGARIDAVKRALDQTPKAGAEWRQRIRKAEAAHREVVRALRGDVAVRAFNENTPTSISERVGYAVGSQRASLSKPTATQREALRIAGAELRVQLAALRTLVEKELPEIEQALEDAGGPWTPGRLPRDP